MTLLSLIVIRSADVEAAIAFYNALGLTFVWEQHGTGPAHYSSQIGEVVLEIYPSSSATMSESAASGDTMLGFRVASLETVLSQLRQLNVEPESPPIDSEWGRWVNVKDPDGRTIQIVEASG
jgi:hypothetical protein